MIDLDRETFETARTIHFTVVSLQGTTDAAKKTADVLGKMYGYQDADISPSLRKEFEDAIVCYLSTNNN